jgi:glycosyltransferase involved in cell wall biosynthesis
MATFYAISEKQDQPSYKSIYLYENTEFQYDADGNAIRCGEMLLRLRTEDNRDIIQLANIKCSCAALKGRCFERFLNILIQEATLDNELFGKQLSPNTKVELFISPDDIPDGVSYETAYEKLYKLYNKYGFNIESHDTPSYLIATLEDIDSTLRQVPRRSPDRTTSRASHKTPRKTRRKTRSKPRNTQPKKIPFPVEFAVSQINRISKSLIF